MAHTAIEFANDTLANIKKELFVYTEYGYSDELELVVDALIITILTLLMIR